MNNTDKVSDVKEILVYFFIAMSLAKLQSLRE